MKCHRCNTLNPDSANFCRHCGVRLTGRTVFFTPARLAFLCVLVLLLAGVIFLSSDNFFSVSGQSHESLQKQQSMLVAEEKQVSGSGSTEKDISVPLLDQKSSENQGTARDITAQSLEVGMVVVFDPWGREIAEIPAAVVDGLWLALPVRACLGGVRLVYYSAVSDFSAEIDGVQWISGIDVGLWRLAKPVQEKTFRLIPWQVDSYVRWFSLVSPKTTTAFLPVPDWQHGYFLHTFVTPLMDEPGVFVLNGFVSGWTFGRWLEGGYLWNRDASEDNQLEFSVDAFYLKTFAGGREELFSQALALGEEISQPERMQMFLDGFQLPPKLAPYDVPEHLLMENIISHVRTLGREMRSQGRANRLVELVDVNILRVIGDFGFLKVVVGAALERKGYEHAVGLVENTMDIFQNSPETPDLDALHLKLYQLWMEKLLAEEKNEDAQNVLEKSSVYFADDPQFYLDGVLLLLRRGDWGSAERLLGARSYPAEMRDRVARLWDWISHLKGSEAEIVIRFSPGGSHIPVRAIVNDEREIAFLVDTGASFVTIPISFVHELDIVIDENTPKRNVATAGGRQTAWVVTLASIELKGWVVRNVEALVLDVVDGNDFGLLGMNFLSKFQLELDSEAGVLILIPL